MSETILPFHTTDEALELIRGLIPGLETYGQKDATHVILIGVDEHAYLYRRNVGAIAIERDLCNLADPEKTSAFLQALLRHAQTDWPSIHRLYEEHVHTAVSFALINGSIDFSPTPRNYEIVGRSEGLHGISLWEDNTGHYMKSEFEEAQIMLGPIGMAHHVYEQTLIPKVIQKLTGARDRIPVIAKSLADEGFLLEIHDPDPVSLMALEAKRHGRKA